MHVLSISWFVLFRTENNHNFVHIEIASGQQTSIESIVEDTRAGSSATSNLSTDDFVETALDEENSRQSSSCDAMSPGGVDFSDDEVDTDMSSDTELN